MGLRYESLDAETRAFMLEEIEMDIAAEGIYLSPYLTQRAQGDWPDFLREAVRSGSDDTLARQLRAARSLNTTTMRRTRSGYTQAKVPHNAAEVMAEGEFNRFYVSNSVGTGPRIGFQSGPLAEAGGTPLISPAKRVEVAQPG